MESKIYVWIGRLCNVETKKFALISTIQYYYEWKKTTTNDDQFYKKKIEMNTSLDEFDPSQYLQQLQDENNLLVVNEMEEPPEFTKHFVAWSTHSTSFKVRFKQLQDPNLLHLGFIKTPRTPRRSNLMLMLPSNSSISSAGAGRVGRSVGSASSQKNLFEHSSSIYEIEHCSNVLQLYNKLFTHKTYSYAVLSQQGGNHLPEGIDKSKLESYLSNDEFKKVFGMDKQKFATLQNWKQTSLKKERNLF